jgi:hypothetical protein
MISDRDELLDFPSAFIQFQIESNSLLKQLKQVRELHSRQSLHNLENEFLEGVADCQTLTKSLDRIERDRFSVSEDLETYKLSKIYRNVQRQKRQILRLSVKLDGKMQMHAQLKAEHSFLGGDEQQTDANEFTLDRLMHKLALVRRKHCETCEALLHLQNSQALEIERLASRFGEQEIHSDRVGKVPASDALIAMLRRKTNEFRASESDHEEPNEFIMFPLRETGDIPE